MTEITDPAPPARSERDQNNRALAVSERRRLVAERDALLARPRRASARLWYVERKLADLAVINQILDENPDARLLLLDVRSQKRTMAAVALGDVDAADHIAVTVPGANVAVSPAAGRFADVAWTLVKLVAEARALKNCAEQILKQHRVAQHGSADKTVATVVWLGYQSPNLDGPSRWATLRGRFDVYSDRRARAHAPALSRFYEELAARIPRSQSPASGRPPHSWEMPRPAPRVIAIGHSYGSLVTARALRLTAPGVVGDAVFCGSPGIQARPSGDADQLRMAAGHVWALMADADEIRDRFALRRLKIFGAEPTSVPWVVQLSTREGVGPGDGVRHAAPPSHGDYPTSYDSDGDGAPDRLHMSGHNLACVVAGRADLAVKGP